MADVDVPPFSPEDEERLWAEIDACVSAQCETHETIDDALRGWLELTSTLRERSPRSQEDPIVCAQMLLDSQLFQQNRDYVRTQLIHSLLQEDEVGPLHAITSLLLLDGHYDESTFPRMVQETCFPRLVELIKARKDDDDPRLHRFLLQLMYEMSRVERLKPEELILVDDDFIHSLFRIIEGVSDDVHDPYHYPTIRVLLVMNEQYMLASTDSGSSEEPGAAPLTNRIVKCLSLHGPRFRTFGENIILLLNRETETSLQLLILKLLYLLFTTKATYEYFYTNDLRVLLDVIIRNLMDLPDERISLRHTYLRVMYPLLAHTQLSQPPYYKQDEIFKVLKILRGSHNAHFAPADETTLRLVDRVTKVKWLEAAAEENSDSGQAEVARKLLGISLSPSQGASSISVVDVAGVMEKPGVQTPSRKGGVDNGTNGGNASPIEDEVTKAVKTKRPLPAVPKHRHGVPFNQASKPSANGGAKKVPPKAPPPRRWAKMKAAEPPPIETIDESAPE
ncbi:pre-rRNA processing [Lecanicillium sp. MT-2017a]|nr:pre-rRNA processing [Lecanicillium sp. MT-2017a]